MSDELGVRRHDAALNQGDMSPLPESVDTSAHSKLSTDWHHSPLHRLSEQGIYMVTAGTLHREHFFKEPARLDLLQQYLLDYAIEFGWSLQAWSIFPNHYHFIASSSQKPENLKKFLGKLHMKTAQAVNRLDGVIGRKVWHQFWDSHITFENSYWPRLRYVQENPVKHGLVSVAAQYPWCSASWFERTAEPAMRKKMESYKIDYLQVPDEF